MATVKSKTKAPAPAGKSTVKPGAAKTATKTTAPAAGKAAANKGAVKGGKAAAETKVAEEVEEAAAEETGTKATKATASKGKAKVDAKASVELTVAEGSEVAGDEAGDVGEVPSLADALYKVRLDNKVYDSRSAKQVADLVSGAIGAVRRITVDIEQ